MSARNHAERVAEQDARQTEPVWSEVQAGIVEDMQCRRGEVGDHYKLYMDTLAKLHRAEADRTQMSVVGEFLARYTLKIVEGPCPQPHGRYVECNHCAARRMARDMADLIQRSRA